MAASPRQRIRTSRLYKVVAAILSDFDQYKGDLKSLVYNSKDVTKSRQYALARNVLKHRSVLDYVIGAARLDKEPVDQYILRVLVYEQLFNKKEIEGNGNAVCCVKDHRRVLEDAFSEYLKANNLNSVFEENDSTKSLLQIPRYARVNTLKTTMADVHSMLQSEGFVKVDYDSCISYAKFIDMVKHLHSNEYLQDLHIDFLLVFHPETSFYYTDLYKSGKLLLQDKASCFPVLLLNPKPDSYIVDACAAPGMKSTHLAALINNDGIILAHDRDEGRISAMRDILNLANATSVKVRLEDFTSVNPRAMPYSMVKYILVDPSCSGSGIVKRTKLENEPAISDERLKRLSRFQLELLLKALSFRSAERVVYSTCSIHCQENEWVIKHALKKFRYRYNLLQLPPEWPYITTDLSTATKHWYGTRCLRTFPERDLTNGFFVAVFEKKPWIGRMSWQNMEADKFENSGRIKKSGEEGKLESRNVIEGQFSNSLSTMKRTNSGDKQSEFSTPYKKAVESNDGQSENVTLSDVKVTSKKLKRERNDSFAEESAGKSSKKKKGKLKSTKFITDDPSVASVTTANDVTEIDLKNAALTSVSNAECNDGALQEKQLKRKKKQRRENESNKLDDDPNDALGIWKCETAQREKDEPTFDAKVAEVENLSSGSIQQSNNGSRLVVDMETKSVQHKAKKSEYESVEEEEQEIVRKHKDAEAGVTFSSKKWTRSDIKNHDGDGNFENEDSVESRASKKRVKKKKKKAADEVEGNWQEKRSNRKHSEGPIETKEVHKKAQRKNCCHSFFKEVAHKC